MMLLYVTVISHITTQYKITMLCITVIYHTSPLSKITMLYITVISHITTQSDHSHALNIHLFLTLQGVGVLRLFYEAHLVDVFFLLSGLHLSPPGGTRDSSLVRCWWGTGGPAQGRSGGPAVQGGAWGPYCTVIWNQEVSRHTKGDEVSQDSRGGWRGISAHARKMSSLGTYKEDEEVSRHM